MIEIIPNWHPLLVHFTLGLLAVSVLFYWIQVFLPEKSLLKQQWLIVAKWSLWTGCLFAVGTAVAGWFAYNSVAHDEISHAAMTLHRNWAIPTVGIFLLLGLWAKVSPNKDKRPGFFFLMFSLIAAGLLMFTGWLGAEAVYRYGLGVKSLPVTEAGVDGHNHSHINTNGESAGYNHQHESLKISEENSSAVDLNDTEEILVQPVQAGVHQHNESPEQNTKRLDSSTLSSGHQHTHSHDTKGSSHHH